MSYLTVNFFTILEKLDQVNVKSKFFKETSVSAVFGDQPVKRDSSRLKEIQETLKKSVSNINIFLENITDIGTELFFSPAKSKEK